MTWAHKTLLPRAVQGSQAARGSLDILAASAGLNACKMVALNAASLGARGLVLLLVVLLLSLARCDSVLVRVVLI